MFLKRYNLKKKIALVSGAGKGLGRACAIALMAFAATLISNWIKKYKWIAWAGLLAILIVAIELIYTDIQILFL